MPTTQYLPVKDLSIDLRNYRTRVTTSESDAIHALIALRPHYFWDLMRSLIEDGYHGTENILVLETGKNGSRKVVREGNRRIGAMKIIHGFLKRSSFDLPPDISEQLDQLPTTWRQENGTVPCRVYAESEADAVTRLVRLTHGRGESAGRLNWDAVARSRFNRDVTGGNEPALDLLERYLDTAKRLTEEERQKWGGSYPVTVLNETLQKVATRYDLATAREVVTEAETNTSLQKLLGPIIHDIGTPNPPWSTAGVAGWPQCAG